MKYLLHHYVSDSAARTPDAVAVVDKDRSLTYRELDERSDRLAARLVELGVQVGDRVGIYLPKALEGVIGIYGAMKAGAAYVPIDPSAPEARVLYIAENCGIRHMVSGVKRRGMWEALGTAGVEHIMAMDTDDPGDVSGVTVHPSSWIEAPGVRPEQGIIDQDLAYILYTSGSTGDPKGVMLSHLNCRAFVEWAVEEYEVTGNDRISSHAPFHFDLSTFDLYSAALVGAPVYLVPAKAAMFPAEVAKFIRTNEISVWYSVPSILIMLIEKGGLEQDDLPSLRTLLFAGEVFPTKYLSRLMKRVPRVRFANLYGPTETNVCTGYTVPEPPEEDGPTISIGRAITNVECFVVDETDQLVEKGDVGELLVRGPTVMAGYWGDPDKTALRLIPSPIPRHHGDPVYRTGDLVEEQPDGNYKFLGRRDNQIKSRGYRIELGDIEAALNAHPNVVEAAALAIPDEMVSNRIVAYVSLSSDTTAAELTNFCAGRIQRYMVPEAIMINPALPKTSTGKIDRQTLFKEHMA